MMSFSLYYYDLKHPCHFYIEFEIFYFLCFTLFHMFLFLCMFLLLLFSYLFRLVLRVEAVSTTRWQCWTRIAGTFACVAQTFTPMWRESKSGVNILTFLGSYFLLCHCLSFIHSPASTAIVLFINICELLTLEAKKQLFTERVSVCF